MIKRILQEIVGTAWVVGTVALTAIILKTLPTDGAAYRAIASQLVVAVIAPY